MWEHFKLNTIIHNEDFKGGWANAKGRGSRKRMKNDDLVE